jgi:hypothetical protein
MVTDLASFADGFKGGHLAGYNLAEQDAEYAATAPLEPRTPRPIGEGCPCVITHAPAAYVAELHHIVPRSWGGPDVPENLASVCNNTHQAVHHLLDDHVRLFRLAGALELPWTVLRRYSAFQRDLAARGWAGRPERPTFTLQLG